MNHLRNLNRNQRARSGVVLVAVLVCLSVITVLVFSAMQTSLRQRKQLDRELQMEQTRLLAEAGIAFASRLIESSNGETDIDPATLNPKLHQLKTSEVKIETTKRDAVIDVKVTAWIGLENRPETQTRQTLNTSVKITSEE